jgi:hypothetical protein
LSFSSSFLENFPEKKKNSHEEKKKRKMDKVSKLLNLCPHDVKIRGGVWFSDGNPSFVDDAELTFPAHDPQGARCDVLELENKNHSNILGFRVIDCPHYGKVTGLPTDRDDGKTGIIVSQIVGMAIKKNPLLWKGPVYGLDSGPSAIRDEKGQIVAVTGLILYKDFYF